MRRTAQQFLSVALLTMSCLSFFTAGARAQTVDCATTTPPTCNYVAVAVGSVVPVTPTAFATPSPACEEVVNSTCPQEVMVPTGSQAEWASFVANPESCLGVAPCGSVYSWTASGFGACSATCGGGTQTQTVSCVYGAGTVVNNSFCAAATMPAASQACNTQSCSSYAWVAGLFGVCPIIACGNTTTTRTVTCQQTDASTGIVTTVANSFCDPTTMPATTQTCTGTPCVPAAAVDGVCGGGLPPGSPNTNPILYATTPPAQTYADIMCGPAPLTPCVLPATPSCTAGTALAIGTPFVGIGPGTAWLCLGSGGGNNALCGYGKNCFYLNAPCQ